jgi:hypothetical protein
MTFEQGAFKTTETMGTLWCRLMHDALTWPFMDIIDVGPANGSTWCRGLKGVNRGSHKCISQRYADLKMEFAG